MLAILELSLAAKRANMPLISLATTAQLIKNNNKEFLKKEEKYTEHKWNQL